MGILGLLGGRVFDVAPVQPHHYDDTGEGRQRNTVSFLRGKDLLKGRHTYAWLSGIIRITRKRGKRHFVLGEVSLLEFMLKLSDDLIGTYRSLQRCLRICLHGRNSIQDKQRPVSTAPLLGFGGGCRGRQRRADVCWSTNR